MLKDTDLHYDNKWLRNLLEAALNEDLDNCATEDKINTILDLKKWASTIGNLNMKHCNELKHICIEADKLCCCPHAGHYSDECTEESFNPGQPEIPADWVLKKKDGKVVTTLLSSTTSAATAPAQKVQAKAVMVLAAWDKEDDSVAVILPCGSPLHSAVIEEADSDNFPDELSLCMFELKKPEPISVALSSSNKLK
ncbi:hypothetical protein C0995_006855 [Termitomyces sp. Mi166|nr:hypothetical protein C0995_006855 [Termitomyces sp. Mi166\